jgi:hypothetical protein
VQITIDIELRKHRRVIRRMSGFIEHRVLETHLSEIERVDERIDQPHRALFAEVLVE